MLDYVFFDEGLRERFADFARNNGVVVRLSVDECTASIPDDLSDELNERIDHFYEKLLQENAQMLEGTEHGFEKNAAGVRVVLANGSPCTIRFDPDLLARILQSITMEELRDMVQHIATSVENPDDRPLCHT